MVQTKCTPKNPQIHRPVTAIGKDDQPPQKDMQKAPVKGGKQPRKTSFMLCRAVRGEELKISIFNFNCLGVIYCIYSVYCDTQLLVFRFSFLRIT